MLCLEAHCDDIEIGCGETLLRLTEEHPGLSVYWVVFSLTPQRAPRKRGWGAAGFLAAAGEKRITSD